MIKCDLIEEIELMYPGAYELCLLNWMAPYPNQKMVKE